MSLFGGMIVKDEPEPPAQEEAKPSGSAFSFMNQNKANESEPEPESTAEPQQSAFSFMKKAGSSASIASKAESPAPEEGGSAFKFMKKPSSADMVAETKSDASPTPAASLAPVVLPPAQTSGPKKKKKGGIRPGHARAEVMDQMSSREQTPAERTAEVSPTTLPSRAATKPQAQASPTQPAVSKTQPSPVSASPTKQPTTTSPQKQVRHSSQTSTPPSRLVDSAPSARDEGGRGRTGSFGRRSAQPSQSRVETKSIGSKMSSFFGLGSKKKGKPTTPVQERRVPSQATQPPPSQRSSMPRTQQKRITPVESIPSNSVVETSESLSASETNQDDKVKDETPSPPEPEAEPDPRLQESPPDNIYDDNEDGEADVAEEAPPGTDNEDTTETGETDEQPHVNDDEAVTVSQKSMRTVGFAKELGEEIMAKFEDLDEQQRGVLDLATAALDESVSNRQSLKSKTTQLEEAIASEDYELAAALEGEIADINLSLDAESQTEDTTAVRKAIVDLLDLKREAWAEEITLHQSTVEELQNSIHAQEEEVKGFEWELDAATADERADLDSRQAKLKKMKGHLALDRSGLDEQMERYQKKSDDKTAAFVKEKNRLSEARSKVTDKIAELKLELKRLEQEEEDLSKSIAVQDDRIAQAESGLSNEKKAMDEEAAALDEREAELSTEEQELELWKARLADNEAEFRSQHEDLEISLNQARDHIAFAIRRKNQLTRLQKSLDEFLVENDCLFDPNALLTDDTSAEVTELRKKFAEASQNVQSLTSEVLDKQSTSSSLRKQLEDYDDRIPELERAKKLAVSGRNFKEAGQINNQIKELGAAKERQQTELEELNGKLLTQTEVLDEAKELHAQLQEKLKKSEVNVDTGIFEELKKKSQDFRAQVLEYARVNDEIAKIVQNNAKICELMLSQLSIKHDIEWSPDPESLDALLDRALATRGPDGEELLLLLDSDVSSAPTGTQNPAVDLMGDDLLGLDLGPVAEPTSIINEQESSIDASDNLDESEDDGSSNQKPIEAEEETVGDMKGHNSDTDKEACVDDNSDVGGEVETEGYGDDVTQENEDDKSEDEGAARLAELEDLISAKESEMEAAAESEDFDLADQISNEIDTLKAEKESLVESTA